jgi:acylphosphatase
MPQGLTTQSARLRITGRVQGVGYRAWAIETAARLGLRGWVRNRNDGSVEVLAIGDEDAVAAMIEACRDGPFAARVTEVQISDAADDGSGSPPPRNRVALGAAWALARNPL